MKTIGLALLGFGILLFLLFILRPLLAGIEALPVILQIALGLIALGIAIILVMVIIEKARSGGE